VPNLASINRKLARRVWGYLLWSGPVAQTLVSAAPRLVSALSPRADALNHR